MTEFDGRHPSWVAGVRRSIVAWGRPVRGDLIAGITNALVYLPQGIGYGLVSGVNPVYGLYTGIFAPLIAACTASSIFMVVIATNELSVPTGRIAASLPGGLDPGKLAALTLLVGLFALAAGVLRIGYAVRFISNSVMTGFVLGVMLLLILGQAANLTGFEGEAHGNDISKIVEIIARPQEINLTALGIGIITILAVFALQRTKWKHFAFLIPMVLLTAAVWVLKPPGVPLAGDAHSIVNGLPHLVWPDWKAMPGLVMPALSLTVIGLSFSAGVAEAFPNPKGLVGKPSQDFLAQGLANLGGAFLQCLPAAGSMSRTVYVVEAGARTRWANIMTGLSGIVIVLTVAGAAAYVPLSVVGGMLIVIGVNAIDPHKLRLVWAVNWSERLTMLLTAALTVFASPTLAIFTGVILSLLVVLVQSASGVTIHSVVRMPDGRELEQPDPKQFDSNTVLVLRIHGFLYFAGVESIEDALAPALEAHNLALVISLRKYTSIGSTGIAFFERFARALHTRGNTMLLADVTQSIGHELATTKVDAVIGVHNIFVYDGSTSSLDQARGAAEAWCQHNAAQGAAGANVLP